jgi:hypothetical protein
LTTKQIYSFGCITRLTGEQNGDEQQISCEASMLIIITTLVGALIALNRHLNGNH